MKGRKREFMKTRKPAIMIPRNPENGLTYEENQKNNRGYIIKKTVKEQSVRIIH
jgi:hypothetical protein